MTNVQTWAAQALIAAAYRLTKRTRKQDPAVSGSWAAEAWDMYGQVGELRFIANVLSNRMGKARLYVGRKQPGGEPIEVADDAAAAAVLRSMGDELPGILTRLGLQLFVADGGYLCGLPAQWLDADIPSREGTVADTPLEELRWAVLSTAEVSVRPDGMATLKYEGHTLTEVPEDSVFLVRVWRPHPRDYLEADSPVRSSLPVLRELVGLTKHVSAQIDSRLAGAGVLFVPKSIEQTVGVSETDDTDTAFSDSLLEAMMTAIDDRDSAAAVVPLVVGVPPDELEGIKHLTMGGALDAEARPLREEAIRRLALGLDCPPEVLLGQGGMNHWGAWLIDDQTVGAHLEPPLTLICNAITEAVFRPILLAQGHPADDLVVWYDTTQLTEPVSRLADALELVDRGLLDGAVAVREAGFDPVADAPAPSSSPAPEPESEQAPSSSPVPDEGPPPGGPPS